MAHFPKERSDVARHRTVLLDSAAKVFAEQGVNAPLEAVVAESGLGRATLYRHFRDRVSLFTALFDRDIGRVVKAGQEGPRGKVFFAMLAALGREARRAPLLTEGWRAVAPDHPEMLERQNYIIQCFEQPLADAIAAGEVRADLTIDDVASICRMVAAANLREGREDADADRAGARRLELLLQGIRK